MVADTAFAARVERMLEEDLRRSQPVPADVLASKPYWFRLAVRLAALTAPVQ